MSSVLNDDDGGSKESSRLNALLQKPIVIPPTSGEDLFAAYLKMS
jgi:hypothetical protein